ncbi:deaminase [Caballeronia sp. SEWSISQ10-4 2]|uniref:anti-phage dCTP deaminase n=1 Tax=Caballeronia sp. SEWSISQ10-4 2 TaxID=2937438 RepID=UPI00264A7540|nr:anti-phage dCTP deaminase [Caballeronia sp. SEWSISQ10-4 2]MDN7178583.1 deaminase [Caballeronia sp. SEWSISQ10-4 2]
MAGATANAVSANSTTKPQSDEKVDSTAEATASLTPELVIALCGPIGSPIHETAKQIGNALSDYGYRTVDLRLSELIRLNADPSKMDRSSCYHEIQSLISQGDRLREEFGNDILAKMAIAKVSGDRRKAFGEFKDRAEEANASGGRKIRTHRICHVIDSVKNSAELDLLRLVYGDALFAIGIFSPLEVRQKNLERPGALSSHEIKNLVDTDSGEEFSHGQSVRDTFPRCDYFLRVDYPVAEPFEPKAIGQLVEKLRRFFSLIFRTSIVTPSPEETAMYAAASAGRNSACLSRQVGAAVTTAAGELLSVGWNDVPRSGGGLYGKPPFDTKRLPLSASYLDERCFAQTGARCHNDQEKQTIAVKLVDSLVDAGLVTAENKQKAVQRIIDDSRVKDLIEFSRAVHAEMHALLGGSRVAGDRIIGGKLYVTTYPCHSCARHIVAAGISEVHYIEPYRKSLATRLHLDALTESSDPSDKVRLLQFDGVAPRRFIDLFDGGSRKKHGMLNLIGRLEAVPSTHVSLKAIPRLEEVVVAEVTSKKLALLGLIQQEKSNEQYSDSPSAA